MKRLYCIYDRTVGAAAGPLMEFPHDAVAIRVFKELIQDKRSDVGRYPQDMVLRAVASYDPESLEVVPLDAVVISGETLVALEQPQEAN